MREIKFRAKVMGDAGIWDVWKIDWLNLQVELNGARANEWTPMSKIQALMQFTGLLDKNDEEIYEGDLVETYDFFGKPIGIFEVKYEHFGFRLFKKDDPTTYHSVQMLSVIGNVWENPELLEST